MSKPSYTPSQVKQLVDAASETLKLVEYKLNLNYSLKPVKSCLTLLEDLAAGKIKIREVKK